MTTAELLIYVLLLGIVVLPTLWIVYDVRRRGRPWMRWLVFAWLMWPIALITWLVKRRRYPVGPPLEWAEARRTIGYGILVVFAIDGGRVLTVDYLFQVARIEGMAMKPTLFDQNRVIVNMAIYHLSDPQYGDIVMLRYPRDPEKSFVKRVIAQEGDQVRIVDGFVFRNDEPVAESYVPADQRSHDDWGPEVVPEGFYFVMGDNRINSSDSRHWGFVPKKYILGRMSWRWYPRISWVE